MRVFTEPLPIPEPLAALPRRVVVPFGSLALNRDVAAAFGVEPATLRQWRKAGRWPEATWKEGNNPYYRVSDLVPYYYDRFPNAIPDSAFGIGDPADAALISDRPAQEAVTEADAEASSWRENGVTSRENAVNGRDLREAASVADMVLERISETVTAAVREMVEPAPESPAVIEVQAAVLGDQRKEIELLRAEIEALKQQAADQAAALEAERRWRERPLWERVTAKP